MVNEFNDLLRLVSQAVKHVQEINNNTKSNDERKCILKKNIDYSPRPEVK